VTDGSSGRLKGVSGPRAGVSSQLSLGNCSPSDVRVGSGYDVDVDAGSLDSMLDALLLSLKSTC
jgi:hypothetical protein